MNEIFSSNLNNLLGNRKPYRWAAALGLSKSMMTKMKDGHVPSEEALSHIAYCEGVSLSWLLYGAGSRFDVESYSEDDLATFLQKPEFPILKIDLVSDRKRVGLFIYTDEKVTFKGHEVHINKLRRFSVYPSHDFLKVIELASDKIQSLEVVSSQEYDDIMGDQVLSPMMTNIGWANIKPALAKIIEFGKAPELAQALELIFNAMGIEGLDPLQIAKTTNQIMNMTEDTGQPINEINPALVRTLFNGNETKDD